MSKVAILIVFVLASFQLLAINPDSSLDVSSSKELPQEVPELLDLLMKQLNTLKPQLSPQAIKRALSRIVEKDSALKNAFLYDCIGLTSVNLSGFVNVTSIGSHFFYNCDRLPVEDKQKIKLFIENHR